LHGLKLNNGMYILSDFLLDFLAGWEPIRIEIIKFVAVFAKSTPMGMPVQVYDVKPVNQFIWHSIINKSPMIVFNVVVLHQIINF
jgi:hypothetical protein